MREESPSTLASTSLHSPQGREQSDVLLSLWLGMLAPASHPDCPDNHCKPRKSQSLPLGRLPWILPYPLSPGLPSLLALQCDKPTLGCPTAAWCLVRGHRCRGKVIRGLAAVALRSIWGDGADEARHPKERRQLVGRAQHTSASSPSPHLYLPRPGPIHHEGCASDQNSSELSPIPSPCLSYTCFCPFSATQNNHSFCLTALKGSADSSPVLHQPPQRHSHWHSHCIGVSLVLHFHLLCPKLQTFPLPAACPTLDTCCSSHRNHSPGPTLSVPQYLPPQSSL